VLALEAHLRPTLEYLGYAWEDGALADRPPQPVKATA